MKRNQLITILFSISLIAFYSCASEQSEPTTPENNTKHEHTTTSEYQQIGQNFAQELQINLGKALQQAISAKGIPGAIAFCNIKALPITDSISKTLNAKIRRVTDKPRNSANQAKEGELFYLEMGKQALANNKEIKPFISEDEKNFMGYYPIVTNQMCLNCHGAASDISKEALAKIKSLYPNDKAKDYKTNELRGMFVVEIKK